MANNNINIADFKHPGIYIQEINDSVRNIPAQTALINLVVGFSRKGPINKPILITNPTQLTNIFGDIDRQMEKKGCFFHRTILNILGNSPVWAMNLLKTDDNLDLIDYQILSFASDNDNSVVKEAPYSSFFDKSEFWDRDKEEFLTVVKANTDNSKQIFGITNLSDKKRTVFMFKNNDVAGYNDTLDIYYGSIDKVPVYLNPKDQAKDYIVSVAIVAGDYSDYNSLSVDSRFSKYFNKKGLIKNQLNNFLNDKAVTTLKTYSALSIIPYFVDLNGNNIFIETIINQDTDLHGIFTTYNIDAVEAQDYREGYLDLIGSNLVNSDKQSINYLSYNEVISENIIFDTIVLDRQGNAFGKNLEYETKYVGVPTFIQTIGSGETEVQLTGITSYNLSGKLVNIDTSHDTVSIPNVNIGKIRKDTIYIDDNGAVGRVNGFEVSNLTLWNNVPLKPISSGALPIGIVEVGQQASSTSGVGLKIENIIPIANTTFSNSSTSGEITITYNGSNELHIKFWNTKNSDADTNYRKTILNKMFSDVYSKLKSGVSIIKDASDNKILINNIKFINSGDVDNEIIINVSPSININRGLDAQIFYIDDEQTFKPNTGSQSLGMRTPPTSSTTGMGYGIVSINSPFYSSYFNGLINSGDYFYPSLFDYKFVKIDFYQSLGNDYITIWFDSSNPEASAFVSKLSVNRLIKIDGTLANNNIFTILNNGGIIGSQPGQFDSKIDLIVNEAITTESLTTGSVSISGASTSDIVYLKMYLIGANLYVDYTHDKTLTTNTSINFVSDYSLNSIRVVSDISNYKETVEIEAVLDTNRVVINASRYSSLKIGDYLQAYVDYSTLRPNENPKKLTRIISKVAYSADTTLSEIKTDAQIDVLSFGTDKQTYRYTTVEDYVKTYKAILLNGFTMRADSLPDGTESRQSSILDLFAVGTPIYKGLINRNKISWRYFVDCWGNGLTGNSKQQMVNLCGGKLTCLGLLSMPSAKSFKNSVSPSFVDPVDKHLRTDFIALGGNPESNPSFLYTFGQGAGQSNVAYFFPYLTVSDNGRPLNMPPASYVTNTFMNKHLSRLSSVHPWTISAGINNGLITGIGNVEVDLTSDDIDNLNGMGANPIVYKMGRGFNIETNNTAEVSPRSSLSFINSREVLIDIENEMYEMLLTYQWRFNTADVRAEIKDKADKILQRFVSQEGLYAFRNVMDTTNNTPEIIDAQMGVIATFVEITKGLAIIVNQITIQKTGDLSQSGFQNS